MLHNEWRPGYPPGKYYEGMLDDFEVTMTVMGKVWHRRRESRTNDSERKAENEHAT